MFFKQKTAIVNSNNFKKFRIKAFFKIVDLLKSYKSKVVLYIKKHIELLRSRNSIDVYFIKNRIESNKFQIANYFNLANTVYFKIIIENVKNILEK